MICLSIAAGIRSIYSGYPAANIRSYVFLDIMKICSFHAEFVSASLYKPGPTSINPDYGIPPHWVPALPGGEAQPV